MQHPLWDYDTSITHWKKLGLTAWIISISSVSAGLMRLESKLKNDTKRSKAKSLNIQQNIERNQLLPHKQWAQTPLLHSLHYGYLSRASAILFLFLLGLWRGGSFTCWLAYTSFGISKKLWIWLMLIWRFLHCHTNVECNDYIDWYYSSESTQQRHSIGR